MTDNASEALGLYIRFCVGSPDRDRIAMMLQREDGSGPTLEMSRETARALATLLIEAIEHSEDLWPEAKCERLRAALDEAGGSPEPAECEREQVECTGLTASWCPKHGDCTCARGRDGDCDFDAPSCPLHGDSTDHAAAELRALDDEPATRGQAECERLRARADDAERRADNLRASYDLPRIQDVARIGELEAECERLRAAPAVTREQVEREIVDDCQRARSEYLDSGPDEQWSQRDEGYTDALDRVMVRIRSGAYLEGKP